MNSQSRELRSRIGRAFEQHHYRRATLLARMGQQACAQEQDEAGEIRFYWIEGALQVIRQHYEEAFAILSSTIGRIETSRLDLQDPEIADIAARTYGDWANCAALLPDGPPDGIQEMLERQEIFVSRRGLINMTCEMQHARSICLARMGRHQDALDAAEQGIALRRANPDWPGCGLDHHLQIYAERLMDRERWDDAAAVLAEGMDLHGGAVYWELRGRLRLETGRLEDAIADLREGVARDDSTDALRLLGIAYLVRGDRELALDQFRAARAAKPREVENSLWLAAAFGEESALESSFRSGSFEARIVEHFRGRLSLDALLKKAGEVTALYTQRARLSMAHGFLGLWWERRGDAGRAAEHFQHCRAAEVPDCQLYLYAKNV
jgi:tetratricopeptide (TPR) repeat protein